MLLLSIVEADYCPSDLAIECKIDNGPTFLLNFDSIDCNPSPVVSTTIMLLLALAFHSVL